MLSFCQYFLRGHASLRRLPRSLRALLHQCLRLLRIPIVAHFDQTGLPACLDFDWNRLAGSQSRPVGW